MVHEVPDRQFHVNIKLYGPPHSSTLYCVALKAVFHCSTIDVLCGQLLPLPGLDSVERPAGGTGVGDGIFWITNDHVSLQSDSWPLEFRALMCQYIVPGHIWPMVHEV